MKPTENLNIELIEMESMSELALVKLSNKFISCQNHIKISKATQGIFDPTKYYTLDEALTLLELK